MATKLSTVVRNARLDAIETAIGVSAVLKIRTGPPPASVSDPDTGTVLAEMSLPVDWLDAAAGGSKVKAGTWSDLAADTTGTAGHFRIYASDGVTAHVSGTVTATGGGGDMTLDNTSIATGQVVSVASFTLTDGNA